MLDRYEQIKRRMLECARRYLRASGVEGEKSKWTD